MTEVKFCNVPAFYEISVKALYKKIIMLPHMARLFPDVFPKGRSCCRSYMYNCFNSIYPDQVKELIDHANKQRYGVENDKI